MKASELRIGNWVHNSINSTDFQIDFFAGREWCTNVCEFDSEEFDSKIKDLQPIPLTEEWLLKLGFKQCGYEMLSWKHETLLPSFNLDGINWADFDEPHYQFLNYKVADEILRIDYVHQLQNLYFALIGEELTLKS
jgi:hypothetical protein